MSRAPIQFGRVPSNPIITGSLAASGADRIELLVLLGIAAHADGEFQSCPSMMTLARCAGVTERSAQRAIARLERRGIITVHRVTGGRHKTNSYTINHDALRVGVSSAKPGRPERQGIKTETLTPAMQNPDVYVSKPRRLERQGNRGTEEQSTRAMTFPLRGRGEWELPADRLAEYRATFPTIDTEAELRKARLWLVDTPDRRKTAKGMPRFLTGWLGRAKPDNGHPDPDRVTTADLDRICPLVEPSADDWAWMQEQEAREKNP